MLTLHLLSNDRSHEAARLVETWSKDSSLDSKVDSKAPKPL